MSDFDNSASVRKNLFLYLNHEVSNYVNGVKGLCSILRKQWNKIENSDKLEYIEKVIKASNNLEQFIEQITLLESLVQNKIIFHFEKINVIEFINIVIKEYKNISFNKVDINFIYEKNKGIFVSGDVNWLRRLLINLIDNAFKFSKYQEITIKLTEESSNNNSFCKIEIIDQGIGILEEENHFLFNALVRGEKAINSFPGKGIGLALCKEIINAHQGIISAKNNKSKGATFIVEVPSVKNANIF